MVTGLLVFARCAGFTFRAPGFSHPSLPGPLRAGFALVLAIAIASGIERAPRAIDGAALLIALLTEFLLGGAIGMTASLVYDGAYAGGRVVDDYVGVKAIAPSLQLVAPSGFGRVWSLAFTGGFFLSGGYRAVLLGFGESFARIPVGAPMHVNGWLGYAAAFASTIVLVALQVAAPAIALAFVVQIALGSLSRVIPRFGSFTLAFPLAFAAALVATAVAVPVVAQRLPAPLLDIP
ncbi:MAG TPA: flagellar biosynthetic protein FliR [Candidatus Cybelea sp.]|jgi:flagellar biosynthetic protein FliR|nr:flagellar biosynthetic protein FliR [Candidatus Cybelea sp.]